MSQEELYKKHRPTELDQVVGQPEAVATLANFIKNKRVPHALLFTGSSGNGKTTLARILRTKLGCSEHDYHEYNSSNFRGIDFIRELASRLNMAPIGGRCRVFYIDECFAAGTLVSTPQGQRPIQSLQAGDTVCNLIGDAAVERMFKNKVPLHRLVRITLSNGRRIHTTKEHLFLTKHGWESAYALTPGCVLCPTGYSMGKEAQDANLCMVRAKISEQVRQQSGVLFQGVRGQAATEETGPQYGRGGDLPGVWQGNHKEEKQPSGFLQPLVPGKKQKQAARIPRKDIHTGDIQEDIIGAKGNTTTRIRRAYAEQQPHAHGRGASEGPGHQSHERDVACMERPARRQRPAIQGTRIAMAGVGASLGSGIGDNYRDAFPYSPQLQSRPWLAREEAGHRDRWDQPQIEKRYVERCQEDKSVTPIRVASVEVYEPGHNDQAFVGVIGDTERRNGFVEFYDLQVAGHPSYFAGGVAVHNCHALTKDAQNAALKMLEDTPKHIYFMLATTDPAKLIKAIHTRCTEIKVKDMGPEVLTKLLKTVAAAEGIELDAEVAEKIVENCEGSARKALVLLHQIKDIPDSEAQLKAIQNGEFRSEAIQVARALLDTRTSWADMAKLLKGCNLEDPEGMRHLVLGYASAVLLGGKANARAADMLFHFKGHFFDSKKAGLVLACYDTLNSGKK